MTHSSDTLTHSSDTSTNLLLVVDANEDTDEDSHEQDGETDVECDVTPALVRSQVLVWKHRNTCQPVVTHGLLPTAGMVGQDSNRPNLGLQR